jgi:hypothetical protein
MLELHICIPLKLENVLDNPEKVTYWKLNSKYLQLRHFFCVQATNIKKRSSKDLSNLLKCSVNCYPTLMNSKIWCVKINTKSSSTCSCLYTASVKHLRCYSIYCILTVSNGKLYSHLQCAVVIIPCSVSRLF